MKPLVSILIPAFNAEDVIAETIESALAQTWPRIEIVIVDDGSTDGTLAVAEEFASERVSVVAQENQGGSAARNRAFALCQGDYIQWLDADDLLAPDKIERQMAAATDVRDLLSAPWGFFYYRTDRMWTRGTALWRDLSPAEFLVRGMEENCFMTNSAWLVSRELTEAAGPWDPRLTCDDDGEYFYRVVAASRGVKFVPDAWMYYRRSGPGSVSYMGRSDTKMESQMLALSLEIGTLRALEDGERVRAACLTLLQRFVVHFHPERPDLVEELKKVAGDLGGELNPPRLGWKYDWIRRTLGWRSAKRVQETYNQVKVALERSWERVCS